VTKTEDHPAAARTARDSATDAAERTNEIAEIAADFAAGADYQYLVRVQLAKVAAEAYTMALEAEKIESPAAVEGLEAMQAVIRSAGIAHSATHDAFDDACEAARAASAYGCRAEVDVVLCVVAADAGNAESAATHAANAVDRSAAAVATRGRADEALASITEAAKAVEGHADTLALDLQKVIRTAVLAIRKSAAQ
jgi:hypothetical protein